jgi:hypothetical protein
MRKKTSAGGRPTFAVIRHLKKGENSSLFHDIEHPKKRAFLAAFCETGSIIRASAKAGIDRHNHSLWMRKDQIYAAAFDLAREAATDTLESEAVRRAAEGVAEPVFYRGQQCGVIRRYSDTLLIFLLKGLLPDKYRENFRGRLDLTVADLPERIARAPQAVAMTMNVPPALPPPAQELPSPTDAA